MKPFDLKKALAGEEVVTREGDKVKILQTINNNNYPIVGVITCPDGTQTAETWTKCGKFSIVRGESDYDLFMASKKIVTTDITAERPICNSLFTKDGTEIRIYHNVLKGDIWSLKKTLSCLGYTITKEEISILEE